MGELFLCHMRAERELHGYKVTHKCEWMEIKYCKILA